MNDSVKGEGWLLFAGIMVLIVGILNTIWGIAAIDSASFFVEDERFIIEDLSTWGWIILIIGVVQLFAAFSIWSGDQFGRWIGIISRELQRGRRHSCRCRATRSGRSPCSASTC